MRRTFAKATEQSDEMVVYSRKLLEWRFFDSKWTDAFAVGIIYSGGL